MQRTYGELVHEYHLEPRVGGAPKPLRFSLQRYSNHTSLDGPIPQGGRGAFFAVFFAGCYACSRVADCSGSAMGVRRCQESRKTGVIRRGCLQVSRSCSLAVWSLSFPGGCLCPHLSTSRAVYILHRWWTLAPDTGIVTRTAALLFCRVTAHANRRATRVRLRPAHANPPGVALGLAGLSATCGWRAVCRGCVTQQAWRRRPVSDVRLTHEVARV